MKQIPLLLAAALLLAPLSPILVAEPPKDSVIVLNGSSAGRTFEGIGALSAGASSRLLIDYPEPQRSEILDYLFKPNYGAALQHLKVEIGGDINSTDGTEPCIARTREEFTHPKPEYFNRGYEWWLMKEAKKRNPAIVFDVLQWGAPAWVGNGKFYSQDNADLIVSFIKGAKQYHDFDISCCGIWNEKPYDVAWIKLLRQTLDRAGLQGVKIVAADEVNKWTIADKMAADPALRDAVQVVGTHYPKFKSTPVAQGLGKPVWASEDGPWNGTWGGGAVRLCRMYNRNYVEGRMTKTVIWSPVSSYYDNLPLPGSGLMRAVEPWSGHYEVQPAIWATAHTTQFIQPGWKYLDDACVALPNGGSCVAAMAPEAGDFSVVIETMDAKQAQKLDFKLSAGLTANNLHLWRSTGKEQFTRLEEIPVTDGKFQLTAEPSAIYSLTTLTTPARGAAASPSAKPFPADYHDDFESYAEGATPRYFSDYSGAFEVVKRADGKGQALRQVIAANGIEWQKNPFPETFLGDLKWKNCQVSVDALVEKGGFASLFGRVGKIEQNANPPWGVWLKADTAGKWELAARKEKMQVDKNGKQKNVGEQVVLASGETPFAADVWHALKLSFSGETIRAFIDGKEVASVRSELCPAGMVGIGSGWHGAQVDNFSLAVEEPPKNLAAGKAASASSAWSPEFEAKFAKAGAPSGRSAPAPTKGCISQSDRLPHEHFK